MKGYCEDYYFILECFSIMLLYYLVFECFEEFIRFLLEYFDVNKKIIMGIILLIKVVSRGYVMVIKLFLEWGVDLWIRNWYGNVL